MYGFINSETTETLLNQVFLAILDEDAVGRIAYYVASQIVGQRGTGVASGNSVDSCYVSTCLNTYLCS